MATEAAQLLAEYAANLDYDCIPSDVIDSTKRSILDTLGVTMVASTQGEGYSELVELIKDSGGKEESTILGFGGKVPAPAAALANGAMARALMYDDYHLLKTHPSSTTVSAALACAERIGKTNGKDFITSVALGNDISCRMGLSIPLASAKGSGWLTTDVFGVFGATLACGKLLGLDANAMQNALGIALYGCAGTKEAYSGSSRSGRSAMMQAMCTGFRAQSAVQSALMAQKGITGPMESLEGRTGLYNVYFRGNYSREALIGDLGKRFENADIGIKPCPGTWHAFTYVDAVRQLMRNHHITRENVEEITVFLTEDGMKSFQPIEVKRRPKTSQDANHAYPYLVAVAAAKGTVAIRDLTAEGYNDPAIIEFAKRVVVRLDEDLNKSKDVGAGESGPARVELKLTNGNAYQSEIVIPYGHPHNPITWQDLAAKFRDCVSHSARPVPSRNAEQAISSVTHLEDVEDMRQVVDLLC